MAWFRKKKKPQSPITPSVNEEPKSETPELGPNEKDLTVERMVNMQVCKEYGFSPANSLPWIKELKLRPKVEIAGRLHAIKAIVLWLMVPAEDLPDEPLLDFVRANSLEAFLTDDEKRILESPRDDEELRNAIGWKFENAWPLAWYFGYQQPDAAGHMMAGEQMQQILANHTCKLNENVAQWSEQQQVQPEDQVILLEDLFYCIHNAVRSAQMGGDTVPEGFHPVGNGGVIHERRHSLSWMLSEGTIWEETDLST